jgi:polyisoprenoid-binding protein YceI
MQPHLKRLAFVAALMAAASCLPAMAQQKLLPAQSEIVFASRQMGVPVDGSFQKFDAQVDFNPQKPDAAKIAITIDLASASLGAAETEAELAKPSWFDTARFPQASFHSTTVKASGAHRFEVTGKLSIKGTQQDLVVPVALTQVGGITTAQGTFQIKRLSFKIGEGEWGDTSMVANEVQVRFKLTLSGMGPL